MSGRVTLRVTALTAILVSVLVGKSSSLPLVEGCGYTCEQMATETCITYGTVEQCNEVVVGVCEELIEGDYGPDCLRACQPIWGLCSTGCTGEPGGGPPPENGIKVRCDP
jgi:hypothetical protein